ncbi:tetratricopeptide repeat protein [bacterium]|nr:tetratricopeptide repeat protein [bacterium]
MLTGFPRRGSSGSCPLFQRLAPRARGVYIPAQHGEEPTQGLKTMKRILFLVLAFALATGTVFAQTPEIEQKKEQLAEIRDKMANAGTPEEYDKLKEQYEALGAEIKQLVDALQADKQAKAQSIQFYNQANEKIKARRWGEAVNLYKQAVEKDPLLAPAYYMMGVAHQQMKNYEEALKAFTQAINVRSDYDKAYNAKGVVLLKLSRLDEAIETYRRAVQLPSADPGVKSDALNGMGLTYNKMKKYDQAISAFQQAVMEDPDNHEAYFNMGRAYQVKKDHESAVEAYGNATKVKSDKEKYWVAYADALNLSGNYSEAEQAARSAISVKSNSPGGHFQLGWALEHLGRKQDALPHYEKARNDRQYRQSAEYQIKLINGEI